MPSTAVTRCRRCGEGCKRAPPFIIDDRLRLSIKRIAVIENEEDPQAEPCAGLDELIEPRPGEVIDSPLLFDRGPGEVVPDEAHACICEFCKGVVIHGAARGVMRIDADRLAQCHGWFRAVAGAAGRHSDEGESPQGPK